MYRFVGDSVVPGSLEAGDAFAGWTREDHPLVGSTVASAGNVDADGPGDFILGAAHGGTSGTAVIVPGAAATRAADRVGDLPLQWSGVGSGVGSGDIHGDGRSDATIAEESVGVGLAGAAYVVLAP